MELRDFFLMPTKIIDFFIFGIFRVDKQFEISVFKS